MTAAARFPHSPRAQQKCSTFHALSAFKGEKRTCEALLAKRRAREREAALRKRPDGSDKLTGSDSLGARGDEADGMQLADSGFNGARSRADNGSGMLALMQQDAAPPPRASSSRVDDYSLMAFVRPFMRQHTPAMSTTT